MGLPSRERYLTIPSAVWKQYTNVTDGRTDGHVATAKTALTHCVARLKTIGDEKFLGGRKYQKSNRVTVLCMQWGCFLLNLSK